MHTDAARYIPALNRRFLTPAYDWFLDHVMHERAFKDALVREARFEGHERVLDIGCGTGTLTLALAVACPHGEVVGLDGDAEILARARAKAAVSGLAVGFIEGLSYALPWPDASFDRVTASLMLHHLTRADKARTFHEIARVLRPGGQLHIADFGPPEGPFAKLISHLTIHLEETKENLRGELPAMLRAAGFEEVAEGTHVETILGTIQLLHARH